jgi:Glycosyl transferases group 1
MVSRKRERIRTLYLDSNGVGSQILFVDTVLRGLLKYKDGDIPPRGLRRFERISVLFSELRDVNAKLSYVADWRDAFLRSPHLEVEVCNINNLLHLARCLFLIRQYDLIVISHAAAGDDMSVLKHSAPFFEPRRCKVVMFIGNEYDILDEKISFIQSINAEYICSQLPLQTAQYLYQECKGSKILEMPHALNPNVYHVLQDQRRDGDIGFVGDLYWPFVGDRERTDLIEWFEKNGVAYGLVCDIRKARLTRADWNRFLNNSKAIIGAESGTYYLNDRGRLLNRARAYNLFENQNADFDEIFERFFRGQPRTLSGKSISSRHFEAIGAKSCQILLEGTYNGLLEADTHYISVKKDLSNISEAIERFRDESYRNELVERTYEYVLSAHTYNHRVETLISHIL